MKTKKKYLTFKNWSGFTLFVLVLLLDRLTKTLVLEKLQTKPFHVLPYVDFVFVQNKGVAFGLFGNSNINFTIISILSIGIILFMLCKFFQTIHPLLIGLLLAGSFGNIWDRLLYGFVVDFIKIGSFYVFNVADSAITISAFWIVYLVFHENRQTSKLPVS